jgi:prepilin-type N-terminal cleavage/methylation domain-containing protein
MAFRRPKSQAGITLVEVMAAIVIISIAVLGASGYRYYSALDARRAAVQSTAARIALLLSENWRGLGYDRTTNYDPASYLDSDMTIAVSSAGPDYPSGFTSLGRYEIVVNNARYWAALSYKDDAGDLRTLNTVVAWAQRPTDSDDVTMDKTFKLTTFVAN